MDVTTFGDSQIQRIQGPSYTSCQKCGVEMMTGNYSTPKFLGADRAPETQVVRPKKPVKGRRPIQKKGRMKGSG
jgi:ssDNA-binding Zn-finger/Zn-ribbon topoisomerase 1